MDRADLEDGLASAPVVESSPASPDKAFGELLDSISRAESNLKSTDAAKQHKSILPCTPLAIIKLLEMTEAYSSFGLPFAKQTITIFNRSEVVGKPLAYMLNNDGGTVYSFDVSGGIVSYYVLLNKLATLVFFYIMVGVFAALVKGSKLPEGFKK